MLCVAGPVDGVSGDYLSPTYFFEFNPATNTLAPIANPPTSGVQPFTARFILLPTGQVLYANGSSNVQVYTPSGTPDPMWKPNITQVPATLVRNLTYTLSGRQINGVSQAVSYGDDATMATNYPIVRIQNSATGHVFFCRTFNHSTLAVNTGTVVHTTQFTVPAGAELGAATLTVIANGIQSDAARVSISQFKLKEVKELKLEVKEIEKLPDLTRAAAAGASGGGDPELLAVMQALAERLDQIEVEKAQAQTPFIQPEERPEVGKAAVAGNYPSSRSSKRRKAAGATG